MTITFQQPRPDTLVITPSGTVDDRNADGFVRDATAALEGGVTRVIVDCSELRYISSYGLGAFIRVHKRLAEQGQALVLACVSEHLFTQLRLVRLTGVFTLAETVAAALA